jgi:16S rRNA G966 N2-methylase RsmD
LKYIIKFDLFLIFFTMQRYNKYKKYDRYDATIGNTKSFRYDRNALENCGLSLQFPISHLPNTKSPITKSKYPELYGDYCDLRLTVDDPDQKALDIFNRLIEHTETPEFQQRMIVLTEPNQAILDVKTKHPKHFMPEGSNVPVYMIINTLDNDYEDYNIISSYFTDTARTKSMKDNMSVYDFFQGMDNKSLVLYVAKYRCDQAGKIYDNLDYKQRMHELREAVYHIYGKRYECTSHRVTTPLSLYKYFNVQKVLDTSAGWGDRSIAAMAAGASYTGLDPNPVLHPYYARIKEVLKPSQDVKYVQCCAEDYLTDELYDIMYVSPPYFTMEKYTNDPYQSIKKFPEYNQWLNGFLFPMLNNTIKHIRPGGHICINIINWVNDRYNYPMLDDVIDHMISVGQTFMGFIWYNGGFRRDMVTAIATFQVIAAPITAWVKPMGEAAPTTA